MSLILFIQILAGLYSKPICIYSLCESSCQVNFVFTSTRHDGKGRCLKELEKDERKYKYTKLKWSKANGKSVYAEHGIINERNQFLRC